MKFLKFTFIFAVIVLIVVISILLITGYVHYTDVIKEKPLITTIESISSDENFVTYDQLPENYINALLATEDSRFYEHGAIDILGIIRATFSNIVTQDFTQGGSTITQQFAKNLLFTQDKNVIRKISEVFASYDIEKLYTKTEILAFYADITYFGDGHYGIYDASYGYFDKHPSELTLDECSMLAGIPNAPSLYAPTVNLELALQRQQHVLSRMVECGYITTSQMNEITNN